MTSPSCRPTGATGLTPITLGSSGNLRVGQDVVAIGSPLGLEGTVTTGIVSALNRPVAAGGDAQNQNTVLDAIQTDAAINPGNSGGALVNMNGELVGVNSAIATLGGDSGQSQSGSIGLGFAIPVDQAKRIADELIQNGTASHASLGVQVGNDASVDGAKIVDVTSGGAAAAAGLPSGVVVTKVDDRVIGSADALVAAVRSRAPGDKVTLTYLDPSGKPQTVDVTLGKAAAVTIAPGRPDAQDRLRPRRRRDIRLHSWNSLGSWWVARWSSSSTIGRRTETKRITTVRWSPNCSARPASSSTASSWCPPTRSRSATRSTPPSSAASTWSSRWAAPVSRRAT